MIKELCEKYNANKGSDELSKYFPENYEHHFKSIRNKKLNILEIGVQGGGSLKVWADYFSNATITGVDINKKCLQHETDRVKVLIGDQSDKEFLSGFGTYDIIIDDGGHEMKQQKTSLKVLWSHLNPGGIYVIEDLETSYWPQFGGKLRGKKTAISYLKKFIDKVNWRAICHKRAEEHRIDANENGVESIHFYPSICFIHKRNI